MNKLEKIADLSAQIEAADVAAELLRVERAKVMAAAIEDRYTKREVGDAAGMSHPSVIDSVRTLGPGTDRAKKVRARSRALGRKMAHVGDGVAPLV